MTSPQKIRANQRNALRSTGPRTAAGKKYSARNSQKHGLSMLGAVFLEDPKALQVTKLLIAEGMELEQTRRLAQTILAYERNEAHQRELFSKQCNPKLSEGQIRTQKTLQETAQVVQEGGELYRTGAQLIGVQSEEARMLRVLLRMAATVNRGLTKSVRDSQRAQETELRQARRHYKRAANQLAKAIKLISV